jgi:uncharacterized protein YjbI with pentapeptide repeats
MLMKTILLTLLSAAISIGVAAEADLNLQIHHTGGVTASSWLPRLIVPANAPSILPDYEVQRSSDLNSWQAVHRVKGGIGLDGGPITFFPTLAGSNGPVFFRVLEQVDLPGADLRGIALADANLTGANLAGVNLAFAALANVNLSHADLSGADLSYADLTYADFSGANLTNAVLDGTLRLYTVMPDGRFEADDPDAELIDLETAGELLAPKAFYTRIRRDLAAIRAAFPEMASIHAFPPWRPGALSEWISQSEIELLKASEFAPVTVYSGPYYNFLSFWKPYNPVALAQELYSRFGISGLSPDYGGGYPDYITLDPAKAKIVKFRFFVRLSFEKTAALLEVNERTFRNL